MRLQALLFSLLLCALLVHGGSLRSKRQPCTDVVDCGDLLWGCVERMQAQIEFLRGVQIADWGNVFGAYLEEELLEFEELSIFWLRKMIPVPEGLGFWPDDTIELLVFEDPRADDTVEDETDPIEQLITQLTTGFADERWDAVHEDAVGAQMDGVWDRILSSQAIHGSDAQGENAGDGASSFRMSGDEMLDSSPEMDELRAEEELYYTQLVGVQHLLLLVDQVDDLFGDAASRSDDTVSALEQHALLDKVGAVTDEMIRSVVELVLISAPEEVLELNPEYEEYAVMADASNPLNEFFEFIEQPGEVDPDGLRKLLKNPLLRNKLAIKTVSMDLDSLMHLNETVWEEGYVEEEDEDVLL